MMHKKLALGAMVILLLAGVTGVSASAPDAGSVFRKLAQGVPGWQQVNSNGFGDPQTDEVAALEAFNGYLYAGTHNPIDPEPLYDGAQIFRSSDGVTWTPVTQPGFGIAHDIAPAAILDMMVFDGRLYASTGRRNASQIWRTLNGLTWAPMDLTGFSDPDNVDVTALVAYGGKIYAGVTNQVSGAQIWSSFTGDNNSWTQVAPAEPGTMPASITGFAEFDGGLYAAVESEAPAQIWQSYGGAWTTVMGDGFGNSLTTSTGGMAVFAGYLYVGAGNAEDGALLYRTNDGTSWQQVITPGFGDPNNQEVDMVFVFQNQLYASVRNTATGLELWRSADGALWEQANQDGFGDSNNAGTNWSNATAEFLSHLFVGTANGVDGGELWRMQEGSVQVSISGTGAGLQLAWLHTDSTVDHYEVYRSQTTPHFVPGGADSVKLADVPPPPSVTVATFEDPVDLSVPGTYYYAVVPVTATGESLAPSNHTGAFVYGLVQGGALRRQNALNRHHPR